MQAAFLSWPLSSRHDPFELLHFHQDLRGGRGRHLGLVGDVNHSEPLAMSQQDRVQHWRTTVQEHGTDGPRQAFRGRLVHAHVDVAGGQKQAAAAVLVADPLVPQTSLS